MPEGFRSTTNRLDEGRLRTEKRTPRTGWVAVAVRFTVTDGVEAFTRPENAVVYTASTPISLGVVLRDTHRRAELLDTAVDTTTISLG